MPVRGKRISGDASFDRVAEGYDFMDSLYNDNDFFLANMPEKKGAALDVGCGSGIVAEALAPHFGRVVGIDISVSMLAIARARRQLPNVEYIMTDASELRGEGEYEYIVSRTTFHHIGDLPELLERLKALLRPGGRIAALDCFSAKPVSRLRNQVFPFWAFPPDCIRLGPGAAARIFRFRESKEWLDHLDTDVYLSREEFRELYGRCLPGCEVKPVSCFMAAVWDKR